MRIRSVAIDSCLGVIASYTFHGLSCQDKLCHTSSQLVLLCHKESYSVTRSRATLVTGLPFGSFATKERRLSLSSPSPSLARFTIFFAYGDLSDLSHFDHLWTISQTSPLTQLWCISGPEFKLLPICLMATLDHHRFESLSWHKPLRAHKILLDQGNSETHLLNILGQNSCHILAHACFKSPLLFCGSQFAFHLRPAPCSAGATNFIPLCSCCFHYMGTTWRLHLTAFCIHVEDLSSHWLCWPRLHCRRVFVKYVCLFDRAHVYIGWGMRQSGGFCESSCQLEGGLPKQRKAHRRCQSVLLLHSTALNDMNGILPVREGQAWSSRFF